MIIIWSKGQQKTEDDSHQTGSLHLRPGFERLEWQPFLLLHVQDPHHQLCPYCWQGRLSLVPWRCRCPTTASNQQGRCLPEPAAVDATGAYPSYWLFSLLELVQRRTYWLPVGTIHDAEYVRGISTININKRYSRSQGPPLTYFSCKKIWRRLITTFSVLL